MPAFPGAGDSVEMAALNSSVAEMMLEASLPSTKVEEYRFTDLKSLAEVWSIARALPCQKLVPQVPRSAASPPRVWPLAFPLSPGQAREASERQLFRFCS